MTTAAPTHHRPPIPFTLEAVIRELRIEVRRAKPYLQLQARRILASILGPEEMTLLAVRPPRLPEAGLSPAQRRQFHLHPLPDLDPLADRAALATDPLPEEEDSPAEDDDPL